MINFSLNDCLHQRRPSEELTLFMKSGGVSVLDSLQCCQVELATTDRFHLCEDKIFTRVLLIVSGFRLGAPLPTVEASRSVQTPAWTPDDAQEPRYPVRNRSK